MGKQVYHLGSFPQFSRIWGFLSDKPSWHDENTLFLACALVRMGILYMVSSPERGRQYPSSVFISLCTKSPVRMLLLPKLDWQKGIRLSQTGCRLVFYSQPHNNHDFLYAQVSLTVVYHYHRENLLTRTVEENVMQHYLKEISCITQENHRSWPTGRLVLIFPTSISLIHHLSKYHAWGMACSSLPLFKSSIRHWFHHFPPPCNNLVMYSCTVMQRVLFSSEWIFFPRDKSSIHPWI